MYCSTYNLFCNSIGNPRLNLLQVGKRAFPAIFAKLIDKIDFISAKGHHSTTLIRLMCGLLTPTEGECLIDGHAPCEYNREELYSLFGLVPQDYHLLPFSIARNVACAVQL